METTITFLTADFCDGKTIIAGKSYPSGTFAAALMQDLRYSTEPLALACKSSDSRNILAHALRDGSVLPEDFIEAANEILYILNSLPLIRPFQFLDIDAERNRIQTLFAKDNASLIQNAFLRQAELARLSHAEAAKYRVKRDFDSDVMLAKAQRIIRQIEATLAFYSQLWDDIAEARFSVEHFISNVERAAHCDKATLLQLAFAQFGETPFPAAIEYAPSPNASRRKRHEIVKRLRFDCFLSFIVADLFEGLEYGHHSGRCESCGKYYLVRGAWKQKYCNGYSNLNYKGKRLSCRKAGAKENAKEQAANHPIKRCYTSRCSCIRMEQSRGSITAEFAATAKALAKEHRDRALHEPEYAAKQYAKDMGKETLYHDAAKLLK